MICAVGLAMLLFTAAGCGGGSSDAPAGSATPAETAAETDAGQSSAAPAPSTAAPAEKMPTNPSAATGTDATRTGGASPQPPADDSASAESPTRPAATNSAQRPGAPRPRLRPDDNRPQHNDAALAELGIQVYVSERLKLYTDIPAEQAKVLPPLVDQLYRHIEKYFGPIPPDREGSPYQMTGYLMRDHRVFRETGLLPEALPGFDHGRQVGRQFWMNDQEHDYYRRHLLLHEATHCLMRVMPYETPGPVWYMEGMAELFGTHDNIASNGDLTIIPMAMPYDREAFAGLGRITMIQQELEAGRALSVNGVRQLAPDDYLQNESYAWSWALCHFLEWHPRFHDRFRKLAPLVGTRELSPQFEQLFAPDRALLEQEWTLFVRQLKHIYNLRRTATVYEPQPVESGNTPRTVVSIDAAGGWQSTGVRVRKGQSLELSATGQFTLSQHPKPWVSEANGISLQYANGQRLGLLMGMVGLDEREAAVDPSLVTAPGRLEPQPIGKQGTFVAPADGTLFLWLNDDWSFVPDNTGQVTVTIRAAPTP